MAVQPRLACVCGAPNHNLGDDTHMERYESDAPTSERTTIAGEGFGGLALAILGTFIALLGLRRGRVPGAVMAVAGASLAYRGIAGLNGSEAVADPASNEPTVLGATASAAAQDHSRSASTTIGRDREPVYLFWRDPANLKLLHGPIEGITVTEDGRQRWRLSGAAGPAIELGMRNAEDVPLERLAWESDGDGPIPPSAGPVRVKVAFSDAPGERGTEVRLALQLPAGPIATGLERLFGPALEAQLRESLRRARQLLEAGEIATSADEPSSRGSARDPDGDRGREAASEEVDRGVAAIEVATW
jgi:uncharacterized membrane protein